jgi:hypothetical protein
MHDKFVDMQSPASPWLSMCVLYMLVGRRVLSRGQ